MVPGVPVPVPRYSPALGKQIGVCSLDPTFHGYFEGGEGVRRRDGRRTVFSSFPSVICLFCKVFVAVCLQRCVAPGTVEAEPSGCFVPL